MIGRVRFHRLAEVELNAAARFYEQRNPGLGRTFLASVRECIESIREQPRSGRVVSDDVRRRLVSRFPYGVLYRVVPDGVRVLAVMNLYRRPSYWIDRR